MAARGGKAKEYRTQINSVREWLKEIEEFDGLCIVEIYSSSFGQCHAIAPTINQIMLSIDDADNKVKWLQMDIRKVEEAQRNAMEEEQKKRADLEAAMKRQAEAGEHVSSIPSSAPTPHVGSSSGSASFQIDLSSPVAGSHNDTRTDQVSVPKLEKWSSYDHPRPLWVFIKGQQVVFELNAANPPKLIYVVQQLASNQPLLDGALNALDYGTALDSDDRRKKSTKKAVDIDQTPSENVLTLSIDNAPLRFDEIIAGRPAQGAYIMACLGRPGTSKFTCLGQTERV